MVNKVIMSNFWDKGVQDKAVNLAVAPPGREFGRQTSS